MFRWLLKCSIIFSIFINIDTKIFESPQIYPHHFFIILLLPVLVWKHGVVPKDLLIISAIMLVIGLAEVYQGNDSLSLLLKTFLGLFITLIYFFYVIREFDYDLVYLFHIYLWGCMLTCGIFFLQLLSMRIGFRPGYDFSYIGVRFLIDKENGFQPAALFQEPSALGILSPGLFVSLYNVLRAERRMLNIFKSLVIISVVLLSSSSTVYLGLLASLIIMMIALRAFRIFLVSAIFSILAFILLYSYSTKFQLRLNDSVEVFLKDSITPESIDKYNGSTLTLYHHLLITAENFKHHPIFGSGIGSHEIAHRRYSPFDEKMWWYNLNKSDANSLLLRLLSEFGLFGFCLFSYFVFKFAIRKSAILDVNLWLISKGILVLILLALLRMGNYMSLGFPFFILLYWYSFLKNKNGDISLPALESAEKPG